MQALAEPERCPRTGIRTRRGRTRSTSTWACCLTDLPDGQDHRPSRWSVGETYDFCVAVEDEVCNAISVHRELRGQLVAGVGTRYIRLLIQDTIAPHLEFTSFDLNAASAARGQSTTRPRCTRSGFEIIEAQAADR